MALASNFHGLVHFKSTQCNIVESRECNRPLWNLHLQNPGQKWSAQNSLHWSRYRLVLCVVNCTAPFLINQIEPPIITSLEFNHTTLGLTCTSTGGPVDSIAWLRDGVEVGSKFIQSQVLVDASSATYKHMIYGREFQGNFTCEVRDSDDNKDLRTLDLDGKQ